MSEIIDNETKLEIGYHSSTLFNETKSNSADMSWHPKSETKKNKALQSNPEPIKKRVIDVPRPQEIEYRSISNMVVTPTNATGISVATDEGSIYSYLVKSPTSHLNTPPHSLHSAPPSPTSLSSPISPSLSLSHDDLDFTEKNETSHTAVLFNPDLLGNSKSYESQSGSTLSFDTSKYSGIPAVPNLGLDKTSDLTKANYAYNNKDAYSDSDDITTTDGQQFYTMTEAFEIEYEANNPTLVNMETLNLREETVSSRAGHAKVPSFPLPAAPCENSEQLMQINSRSLTPTQVSQWRREKSSKYHSKSISLRIPPTESKKFTRMESSANQSSSFSDGLYVQESIKNRSSMSDVAREIKGRLSTDYYKRLSHPISFRNSKINQNTGEDFEAQQLEQIKTTSSSNKKNKSKVIKLVAIVVLVLVILTVVIAAPVAVHVRNQSVEQKKRDEEFVTSNLSLSKLFRRTIFKKTEIPENLRDSIYDVSTWLDTTDFNITYTNITVGGLPIMGLNTTYDNTARPNPLVPPIEDGFNYENTPIRGINLDGWLVLEPFITPSFFEKYEPSLGIVDEWTLVQHLNATEGMASVKKLLETHYATFITEETFKEINEAGFDHVRIPFGYWAVKTWEGDNFLPFISWRYLLRGIEWARKYGIRVNIDLHSLPDGGWNHSGQQETLNWLNGESRDFNEERSLEVHAALSEFFSQERYVNLVTIYGLANELRMDALAKTKVLDWTKKAYNLLRSKGYKGVISFGDGFKGVSEWHSKYDEKKFLVLALEVDQYTIFDNDLLQFSPSKKIKFACNVWSNDMRALTNPEAGRGFTFVGKWSQANNDCTKYLNNVGAGSQLEDDLYAPNPERSS
jgi:aryl-phospho-beta-D-glucosidase BglC (GH1 family)